MSGPWNKMISSSVFFPCSLIWYELKERHKLMNIEHSLSESFCLIIFAWMISSINKNIFRPQSQLKQKQIVKMSRILLLWEHQQSKIFELHSTSNIYKHLNKERWVISYFKLSISSQQIEMLTSPYFLSHHRWLLFISNNIILSLIGWMSAPLQFLRKLYNLKCRAVCETQ